MTLTVLGTILDPAEESSPICRKGGTMDLRARIAWATLLGSALLALPARAADPAGLTKGTPDLKSAGSLAFGPDGVLFVGDTQGAAVFAIDTGDRTKGEAGAVKVEGLDEKVAALLGTAAKQVMINDVAVNPASGQVYLSVSRGRGPDATPVLLRVDRSGKLSEVSLKDVAFAKAPLPNPPSPEAQQKGQNLRNESITDLAYIDGRLYVAGLSNEEFSSRLVAIPYPPTRTDDGASVEIFHGSHGRLETRSPIRTFVTHKIGGEPYVLAAYTCTPLVKIPVAELKTGSHVKGTTIAELGNRNRPLDMIVYQKGGKDFILMANSARGVMKISTDNIDKIQAITQKVPDRDGLTYETIASLKNVTQLDKLDDAHAVILTQADGGSINLETVDLP
jgi:hypothetical protein